MRLVDSHAHLQSAAFDDDADAVLVAARQAGVERLLAPAWDLASSRRTQDLVERWPSVDLSVGVHPHNAEDIDQAGWSEIVVLAAHPRVVAVGETGLDFNRGFASQEAQLANLRGHIDLALRVGKPLILHCRSEPGSREAQDALIRELESAGVRQGVLHSFSGPVDYGKRALDLGLAISISGLAFRRGEEVTAEVVRLVPRDRLLVETDSPYLSPPGAPRRRNEPPWVEVTARWVARQRDEDPEDVGEGLIETYDRLFSAAAEDS